MRYVGLMVRNVALSVKTLRASRNSMRRGKTDDVSKETFQLVSWINGRTQP